MFLLKHEYFSSLVYSKWDFLKKEFFSLSLVFVFINFIVKFIEFKKSNYVFNFGIFSIFLLSSLCVFFSFILCGMVKYDFYRNMKSKFNIFLYVFYNFVNFFLIILGTLILTFDNTPEKVLKFIMCAFILSIVIPILTYFPCYLVFKYQLKKFILFNWYLFLNLRT